MLAPLNWWCSDAPVRKGGGRRLEQIAKLAHEMPQAALTTLAHHIDIDWLREAYRRTRKDGATGVDRQTADEYASNLDDNLGSLLERAKAGTYVRGVSPRFTLV
jgi:hypothetical protein